jgi:hypothetical protein
MIFESLQTKLPFMHSVGHLIPALTYLIRTNYVHCSDERLWLTGKGLRTTESLFEKFLIYIKRHYPDELSHWINTLDRHRNSIWELIRDIYFFVEREPLMQNAFSEYLNEIGNIENVIEFEMKEQNLSMIVDDIFLNMDDVDRLFQHKFKCKLFCLPLAAQSNMSIAIRERKMNLTRLVATIGSVLNGICFKEIEKLLGYKKEGTGPISKIKAVLDNYGINYNPNTIETLRTLYRVRSTTFPLHETGPEIIDNLKKLNITFPIDDYKMALKLLESLNDSLLEMKTWFR